MGDVLGPVILGIFIVILGIFNRKGNIASVHWYHRKRVSEEDRIPFGKIIGTGMIIIGVSVILFGGFNLAADRLQNDLFTTIGSVVAAAGVVIGLILNFYAMIKYNKGIF